MRIVGGRFRGRRLVGPGTSKAEHVRPTSDRAREAIFQVIGNHVTQATVLDLFAGTGAMGLEAASRGASRVVYVEGSRSMLAVISRNIRGCAPDVLEVRRQSIPGHCLRTAACDHLLLQADLVRPFTRTLSISLESGTVDLVFCDPPYGWKNLAWLLENLSTAGIVADGGMVVVETWTKGNLPERCGSLALCDIRRYGAACFRVYTSWGSMNVR